MFIGKPMLAYRRKNKQNTVSCEIEGFVETRICQRRTQPPSRVLWGVHCCINMSSNNGVVIVVFTLLRNRHNLLRGHRTGSKHYGVWSGKTYGKNKPMVRTHTYTRNRRNSYHELNDHPPSTRDAVCLPGCWGKVYTTVNARKNMPWF